MAIARSVTLVAGRCGAQLVVEPGHPLRDPPLQGLVDGDPTRLEILRDRLLVPALDVQADDRQATRCRLGNAMEGRETSMRARGRRIFR